MLLQKRIWLWLKNYSFLYYFPYYYMMFMTCLMLPWFVLVVDYSNMLLFLNWLFLFSLSFVYLLTWVIFISIGHESWMNPKISYHFPFVVYQVLDFHEPIHMYIYIFKKKLFTIFLSLYYFFLSIFIKILHLLVP